MACFDVLSKCNELRRERGCGSQCQLFSIGGLLTFVISLYGFVGRFRYFILLVFAEFLVNKQLMIV